MAYISFQPSDFFNTKLYTGNASTQVISSIGFDPDITWIKERDGANNHALFDRVRGDDKHVEPNLANAEATESGAFAFGTDQFTLGNWTPINGSGNLTVSWNWKAGTTSGLSGGTITPTGYSFNATSGFSVVAYTGTGANATVGHGLGVVPQMIIVKNRSDGEGWIVYHSGNTSAPETDFLRLDTTAATSDSDTVWNDTAPTSSVFSIGTGSNTNANTHEMIAYCFTPKSGYSKFGSYIGNGNADGSFIYTGFRPSFVMVKASDAATGWYMFDDKRLGYNPKNGSLYANSTAVEISSTLWVDLLSNGFKFRNAEVDINGSGVNFIYAAFAAFPFVSSNSIPTVAR